MTIYVFSPHCDKSTNLVLPDNLILIPTNLFTCNHLCTIIKLRILNDLLLLYTQKISDEDTIYRPDNPEQRRYYAKIPSGINLGGLCVMSLSNTVL